MILMAIDYSKAFDSVDFEFIHKTFLTCVFILLIYEIF